MSEYHREDAAVVEVRNVRY